MRSIRGILEDQRQHWREYNLSPRGRERFRRYEKSPRGQAKRREIYRERKRLLAGIKSRAGCRICRETDPQVLGFHPRDPRKFKFLPVLSNITRSLQGWREVIKGCDVLCANCLAKEKRHARSRLTDSLIPLDLTENRPLTWAPAMKDAVSGPEGYHPTCKTCGAELEPERGREFGSRKQYCSDRCRLLSWAARKLLKAYREGRAVGLGDVVDELRKLEK